MSVSMHSKYTQYLVIYGTDIFSPLCEVNMVNTV